MIITIGFWVACIFLSPVALLFHILPKYKTGYSEVDE